MLLRNLSSLGCATFFDCIKNEALFYTNVELVYSFLIQEIIDDQKKKWTLGMELESTRIGQALQDLETRATDGVQFHFDLFSAGVVSCLLYLEHRKIYYMGSDGQYYLENY